MDPVQERKRRRENWAAASKGWLKHADAQRRQTMPVSAWMLDALGLQAGDTVLELAAGPGDLGFMAAEMVSPGGTVISSDFVPEMVAAAQQRAEAVGARNVRFRQIDAQSIEQDAASLDGVLCRWGYMLMPDPGAALRETRRILKPGARVALAAWAGPEDNPWSSLVGREIVRRGWAERPDPAEPGQFAWAKEGLIAGHLEEAGFTDHQVDAVEFEMEHPSVDAWLDVTAEMSRNFATAVAGRTQEETADLRETLRGAAGPYTAPDGSVSFPARSWVAWASA